MLIATTTYTDPGLSRLRTPGQDVDAMAEILGDPALGGFVVTTLPNPTESAMRRAISPFLKARTPQQLALVYFSCHGLLDARNRLYFAATDTDKSDLAASALDATWLREQLDECRARRQVVILDCCHSGAFANTKSASALDLPRRLLPDRTDRDRWPGAAGRGRVVLASSRHDEYSFEGEPVPGATMSNSLFTAALVTGVRTGDADLDNDGYISVEDAFAYVEAQLRDAGAAQTPQRNLDVAEGKIILARSPRGAPLTMVTLPEALQLGLESPFPDIRRGAVTTLGTWLTSTDPARAFTARETLVHIAEADTSSVASVARELLDEAGAVVVPAVAVPARPPMAGGVPGRRSTPGKAPTRHLHTIQRVSHKWLDKRVHALAFSPDGHLLATVSNDSASRLWHPTTGRHLHTLVGHSGEVHAVSFSPDGQFLATGSNDRTAWVWRSVTGAPVRRLVGHSGEVHAVSFSPDGRLLATGSKDRTARLWDPATGGELRSLAGHTNWVLELAFGPDGGLLATGSCDHTVRVWDPASGERLHTLAGHSNCVTDVAFSPDGRLLASASRDHTVQLWDPAGGERLHTLKGHSNWVRQAVFAPDGRLLATGSCDHTVRVWDPVGGERLRTLAGHSDCVVAVAFSPDGGLLASGSRDHTVQLWDPASGERLHTLAGHTGQLCALTFSPDGRLLATASNDNTVRVWG